MLSEEQNPRRKLVLPETIYHLPGKEPVIFVEYHTKEGVEITMQERLGTIQSLDIDKGKMPRKTYQKMFIQ